MHHPIARHRAQGRRLRARFTAALAATAVALLAAPLVGEAAPEPGEFERVVAAAPAALAPLARAEERSSGAPPLRSVWARLGSAAPPASERTLDPAEQRAAAASLASPPLQRWLLSHGTTSSLP